MSGRFNLKLIVFNVKLYLLYNKNLQLTLHYIFLNIPLKINSTLHIKICSNKTNTIILIKNIATKNVLIIGLSIKKNNKNKVFNCVFGILMLKSIIIILLNT